MTERERSAGAAFSTVNELLAQRARILGWLTRLEETRDGENPRVVERVRSDYEQRLHDVVQELTAHLESIRAELSDARERYQTAEDRFTGAEDALHEARLRHRIGELSEEAWDEKRAELEDLVTRAREERDDASGEVSRLEEVLAQIEAEESAPADAGAGTDDGRGAEDAPEPEVAGTSVFEMVEVSVAPDTQPDADPPYLAAEDPEEPDGMDQDLAFLEELDRAIAASSSATDPGEEAEDVESQPAKGTKCTQCGYTNDAEAWYCGVCGVDLA